jgi:1-acyl-sn-glycerol-3-phosphate acyltransferase
MKPLRSAYERVVFWFGNAYFVGICVLWTLLTPVIYLVLPRSLSAQVGKHGISLVFRSFLALLRWSGMLKADLSALDRLRDEPSLLIAPNHPCLLDAVFVVSRIPRAGCIMKAAIWDSPVLGAGARLAGYIRNDAPLSMVRRASREVAAGMPLLVFPEGTRTRSPPVNPFRGGFALIAKHARVPVQTVFIETDNPFLGKGWPLLRKPDMPMVYRVRLGRRFRVEGDVQQFLRELEDYYRDELTQSQAASRVASQVGDYRPA